MKLRLSDIRKTLKLVVPPLNGMSHKGQHGRIGVVGGSVDYTGAPFYAAQSALRFGGDLSFVFCAAQATIPIKSYSPELMVTPFYNADDVERNLDEVDNLARKVTSFFDRLHCLVIGPGLGRLGPVANSVLLSIISSAKAKNLPLVVDADGLWLVTHNLPSIKQYSKCLLTPNAMEFNRLVAAAITDIDACSGEPLPQELTCIGHDDIRQQLLSQDQAIQLFALSKYLGVSIVRKGQYDMVSDGKVVVIIEEKGSPRRCGGQGDILSGAVGVAMSWTEMMNKSSADGNDFPELAPSIVASIMASSVVRKASSLAFSLHKRSVTAPDILTQVGPAFYDLIDSQL